MGINYLAPHPPLAGTRQRTRRDSAGFGGKQGGDGDSAGIMRSQVYSSLIFEGRGYRPFIVKISFEDEFSGRI
jgi:hypothetical protein